MSTIGRTFMELDTDAIVQKRALRDDCGELSTLENSIRKLGLLYPIIVDRNNVLVAGERRLRACRNVGLSRVPVLKLDIDYDSMTALDIQSDVNLCRKPLSSTELESLIEKKKSALAGKPAEADAGIFSKLKKILLGT
jgi:ParB family chromosome partitioning protein